MCSEEVRGRRSGRYDPLRVGHSAEQLGLPCVDVLKHHDGGDVAAPVTVVGGGPHSHQLLVKHELVALVHQLMGPTDQFQVVDVNELGKR